jgi:pimeloyl-[acyl-carrier protein] methyl ester esterase
MTTAIQRQPVILLPGWAYPAQVWAGVMPQLSEFAVPQAMDLPGMNAGTGDVDRILEHIGRQLLARAPERALWIGWSLGGLVAMQIARMAPERVAALVLVACTPKFVSDTDWPNAIPVELLSGFQHSLEGDPSGTLRRFTALCAHNGRRADAAVTRVLSRAMQENSEPDCMTLTMGLVMLMHADLRDAFSTLACPVLCLLGEHDPLVPASVADALMALNPRLRINRIAGVGHALFISHPREFAGAVREFCGGL